MEIGRGNAVRMWKWKENEETRKFMALLASVAKILTYAL